jgi:hypothetical protein
MKKLMSALFVMTLLQVSCLSQDQPSLSKMLLHSTIRIVCVQTNGVSSVGTGFFYRFDYPSITSSIPVVVTCKHVIVNSAIGILDFALAKTNAFARTQPHFQVVIQNFESLWIKHPDTNVDIAVLPIAPIMQKLIDEGKRLDVFPFDRRELVTTNALALIRAFQNVKFIGYPIGISDELNNLPIARQGMTATDVSIDYEGRREFLIDAAVFPGSSGSPVLIVDEGSYSANGGMYAGNRLLLLGIVDAVTEIDERGHIEFKNVPTALVAEPVTKIPSNLGLVIKAEVLNDFEKPLFDLDQATTAKK